MGALLTGAALALPPLLALLLARAAPFARSPLLSWAVAAARQGLPGLSLALMALLLALSVNIGVGTMVDGFRLTFSTWLEDRLAAEAYVRAASPEDAAPLEGWMQPREEVLAILPEIGAAPTLAAFRITPPIATAGRSSPPRPRPGTSSAWARASWSPNSSPAVWS